MRIETDIRRFVRSKTFTLVVLLLLLIVIFTIATGGSFLKAGNIRSILNSLVIVTFLAIGEGFLIIYGNIDLSLGTVGTMCGLWALLLQIGDCHGISGSPARLLQVFYAVFSTLQWSTN